MVHEEELDNDTAEFEQKKYDMKYCVESIFIRFVCARAPARVSLNVTVTVAIANRQQNYGYFLVLV